MLTQEYINKTLLSLYEKSKKEMTWQQKRVWKTVVKVGLYKDSLDALIHFNEWKDCRVRDFV